MRTVMRIACVLLVAAGAGAPGTARAGHDVVRTFDFLGFSADGSRFLLKVTDPDAGDFLSVRTFATGKQEKGIKIEQRKDEKRLIEQARKQYRITDKGTDSQSSPDGRYTIVGVPRGDRFLLNVGKGERDAKWQSVPIESGRSGPAKMTLKAVWWARDGRRLVVVLHKKLTGDNGVDADEARPYEFFPGELTFK
ncbi:MAG: hypothetical protein FJ087_08175 [Deltaproteobacteria bacterium]|nr:hypothetical protein [Deltaproteobacteria bacterium]